MFCGRSGRRHAPSPRLALTCLESYSAHFVEDMGEGLGRYELLLPAEV